MNKINKGSGSGHFPITGAKIVMNLPRALQHPYTVANNMVGNNVGFIRYAKSKAQTMPKLTMKINIAVKRLAFSPYFTKSIRTEPIEMRAQKDVRAFIKVNIFVMKTIRIQATSSANSELKSDT